VSSRPDQEITVDLHSASHLDPEVLMDLRHTAGRDAEGSQTPAERANGSYLEGNLDPAATVRALSDEALGKLADALYRHLDTRSPSFGAHTWYELAAEELHQRHLTEPEGPSQAEVSAG